MARREPPPCPSPQIPQNCSSQSSCPWFQGLQGFPSPGVTQSTLPTDACAKSRPSPTISISSSPGFWPVQGGETRAGRGPVMLLGDGRCSPLSWRLPSKAFLG